MNKSLYGQQLWPSGSERVAAPPIAIIGASCRLPGAPDLEAFWQLLLDGRDAVTEIPDERWNKERYLCTERGQPGKAYTFAAGVIGDVAGFDPAFFGISPREAEQMDPQQRLSLELAYEAIENAGLDAARLAGERVGVFVGGSSWDYSNLHIADPAALNAYSMTGATLCSLANRVSYAFDLRGPSFAVDTACSSSLVALHQAAEAIRAGDVPMALVGGISLLLAPQSFVGFSAASMLSPRGRCHAFSAKADGYVRAEGGGFVVLKPLDAALAAGDPIRAVIRATGVNSDGRTIGFSLPNKDAQYALLEETYTRFGLDRSDLVYVEAHGTGTPAGDPIEAGALGGALGQRRASPLPIGSVKTNIGHLEAASGMAGLIKAMLIAERGTIPASLHCETPNPHIDFADLNLSLVQEPQPLRQGAQPGLIGINSFGFGGTNSHAVLEQARIPAQPALLPAPAEGDALPPLLLSARSDGALHALAQWWRDRLSDDGDGDDIAALVRAQALRREQHKRRLVIATAKPAEMVAALDAYLAGRSTAAAAVNSAASGGVAFVFSGNGSQWAGMAADALANSASFRRGIDEVDAALQPWLGWSVAQALGQPDADALRNTETAQPLLFTIQVALVLALRDAGVEPAACMGHSVGEVAAAWASGALSLDQAARVITARSHGQQARHGIGGMAVVGAESGFVELAMAEPPFLGADIAVAAHNSSQATTIAGSDDQLAMFADECKARGWRYSRLDLDYAFHSAAMDAIEPSLLHDLEELEPDAASVPFFSAVTGAQLTGAALDGTYWWRNIREPVLFAEAARAMIECGSRIFIELGPHAVLQAYLNDALRESDSEGRVLASLSRRPSRRDPIAELVARAHAAGADVRDAAIFRGKQDVAGLPSYPWQRERFWLDPTIEDADTVSRPFDHPLLGRRDGAEPLSWTRHVGIELQPWLADHAVGGAPVMPAAAMIDMALAAARARHPAAPAIELLDVEIGRALVLEAEVLREVNFRIGSAIGDFELASRPRLSDEPWTVHMTGRIVASDDARQASSWPPHDGAPHGRFDAPALYALATRLGLEYGPAFRTVAAVDLVSATEAIARLVEPVALGDGYIVAPNLLDGTLQGLLALAAGQLGTNTGVLPWRFGRVRRAQGSATQPTKARLRLTRVGPRSVRADVLLLDGGGEIVAELLDCWFVRVALGGRGSLDEQFFHTAQVPSVGAADGWWPEPSSPVAGSPPTELALLADAYAASAAVEALRTLLQPEVNEIDVDRLVRDGALHPDSRVFANELLGWLQADGIAEQDGTGTWRLHDADVPSADAILRTLFFEMPTAVADTALLAAATADLPRVLARGPHSAQPISAALWEQLLHDGPSGTAATDHIASAVHAIAATLPAGRPLRLLILEPGQGRFTRTLLRAFEGISLSAVVATDGDDLLALADALAVFPGVTAVAWDGGEALSNRVFDISVGYRPFPRPDAGTDVAALSRLLAPGGTLIAAEAAPSRFWRLLRPAARIVGGDKLLAAGGAALDDVTLIDVSGGLWPIGIVSGRATRVRAERSAVVDELIVIGGDRGPLVAALAAELDARGVTTEQADLDALPDLTSRHQTFALVVEDGSERLPIWLGAIAALAANVSEERPLCVTLVVPGASEGNPVAAAITGVRRVLANEAGSSIDVGIVRLGTDLSSGDAAQRAADELLSADGEGEVSWTAAGRTVARVRTGRPAVTPAAGENIRLAVERPGLLDSLGWSIAEPAQPGPGEIGIEIQAAGLNFRDVMWAMGLLPDEALLDGFAGATLGLECAGTVSAVGDGVSGFAIGDRVMAFAPASLGTHTVTAAHAALPLPDSLTYAEGATAPVAFLTVAYALGQLAQLEAGETLLVHGGAGGVGLAAIQFARHRGARVFATAGSPAKRALLASLGVEAVFDSRSLSFADEVMRITGGVGVDIVLNSLSGESMRRSLGLLKPFGRFLELGKRDFYENSAIGLRPFRHNISYFGVDADQLPVKRPQLAAKLLGEIADLFAQGALKPLSYRSFDFADAKQAFRLMQASGHIGKIVLERGGILPAVARTVPEFTLNADRAYVVTGGLDGFGREAARWLGRKGVRHLALISRRGAATPGADELLDELATVGVDARAYACDVADETALGAALSQIRQRQAPIGGVIHAAVAMEDALLPQLDAERFARAMRPKLQGAELLDRLTCDDPIDLFLLFSSVTTPMGNPGQGNYVAANAAMEAVAERRHAAGLPALAVQWGPIGDAGYLVREKEVSDMLARQLGGSHLTAADALDMIPALLASGLPVAGFATMRWGALRGRLPLLATSLFDDMGEASLDEAGEIDLKELLATITPEELQARVTQLLIDEVGRIMKLGAERIEAQRPLAELGMDSLMAVELRLAVEHRFGVTVPLLALSEGATIAAMAARIVRNLGAGEPNAAPDHRSDLIQRLARHEKAVTDAGPADRIEGLTEPSYAVAAATSP